MKLSQELDRAGAGWNLQSHACKHPGLFYCSLDKRKLHHPLACNSCAVTKIELSCIAPLEPKRLPKCYPVSSFCGVLQLSSDKVTKRRLSTKPPSQVICTSQTSAFPTVYLICGADHSGKLRWNKLTPMITAMKHCHCVAQTLEIQKTCGCQT